MLHHVHRLVSNCIRLLCGAKPVVYSGILEIFLLKVAATRNQANERGTKTVIRLKRLLILARFKAILSGALKQHLTDLYV